MERPLRILVVSNFFPPHVVGGAEVVAYRHAHLLAMQGHEVLVFAGCVTDTDGRLNMEEIDGLRVWRVALHSLEVADNFRIPAIERRLRAVLAIEQPDIVHFHNVAGLGASLIPLASRAGCRIVVTLHDRWGFCFRNTTLRGDGTACQDFEACGVACQPALHSSSCAIAIPMRLRRDYVIWALSHADQLVFPSASLRDAYVEAGAADPVRSIVLSNGIDLGSFCRFPKRPRTMVRFICIAYLGEHKGIIDLLDAAAALAGDPTLAGRWSLTIAGDGHLRSMVDAAIADGRFGGAVTFLGRVPRERIVTALAASHVLVLPSRWPENEPVSLLEAIAAGCAQITTNIGGGAALVDPLHSGALVPPANPKALAACMANYIREPTLAARQGKWNRARRSAFCELATVEKVVMVYRSLLAEPQAAPLGNVVLCAGDWPVAKVATICNKLHEIASAAGVRLIWHEWADPDCWTRAALLWNWSSGIDQAVIRRALLYGLPLLAPKASLLVEALAGLFKVAFLYDTYLQAMVGLSQLFHDSAALGCLRERAPEAAELLVSYQPQSSFDLRR